MSMRAEFFVLLIGAGLSIILIALIEMVKRGGCL